MSRIGKITRRTLLVASAAIVGGVAFGYYAYKKPPHNPLLDELGEGEAAITPYVKIDANGVTLITPRADKGQGAYSVQAALIAEELDVDLNAVKVDPGTPSPAYYNGAVTGEGFPFAATDDGFLASNARGFGDVVSKFMGLQITGGSSTVPDAYVKLRMAGAVARETLKAAAAAKSGVAVARLKTKDGAVVLPDGSSISYVELAPVAATIEPVTDVELRPETKWRYLGKEMRRVDIVAKSTGMQVYGIDLAVEGMVHATVVTNPHIGGAMNGYDASKAEAMPRVQKVVPVTNGVGVIADTTWHAFKAAGAIAFDWGPAPYPATSEEMWDNTAASFVGDLQDSRFRDDGAVDDALAGGAAVEVEYRVPHLVHAPMEPVNAIVLVGENRVDIWTGTQIPRFVQNNVSKLTGIDTDSIHVHVQMMGGSFGRRLEDLYVAQAVEVAMAMKGTPVKMTWSREEDMTHGFPRPMAMARGRGAVRDGKVDAFDLDVAMPSVAVSQFGRQGIPTPGPDVTIVAGAWDQPFSVPDYRVTGYRVPEMVPVTSWRSVGASVNGFFHDSLLDELIHAAGADPMDERIRLCWHEPSRKVLEAVKEMSAWDGPKIGENRGRGVAFCLSFGVATAEVVEVTATPKGIKIDKVYVAAEVGKVLDPVNFENLVMGGVIFGLGHAMNCEITYASGMAEQTNYHAYEGMRLYQCPEIVVRGLESGEHIRGIGEPPVPPAAPALANAIFAATGKRIRELPLNKHIDFV